MIGDLSIFSSFVAQEGGMVTFEDNGKGKILAKVVLVKPFRPFNFFFLLKV